VTEHASRQHNLSPCRSADSSRRRLLHGDQRAAPVRRPGGPDALGITVPTTHTAWSTPIALKHLPHQPRHVGVAPSIFSPTRPTRLQEQPTFHTVCTDAHISLTKFACFDQNQNSPAHLTHRALPHSLAFCAPSILAAGWAPVRVDPPRAKVGARWLDPAAHGAKHMLTARCVVRTSRNEAMGPAPPAPCRRRVTSQVPHCIKCVAFCALW